MRDWSKYKEYNVIDNLRGEEDFKWYITGLREEGADEGMIEDAYREIEQARAVHGISKPVAAAAV
jgi:hypothetical protein